MQNILLLKNREEYDNAPKCEVGKKVMALYEDNGLDYITNDIGSYFIATYNVTSTTNTTQLLHNNFDLSQIVSMYIDGNLISDPINNYKFNTVGSHEIKCSFCQYDSENDKYISTSINVTDMSYMFSGCTSLTSLNFSNFDASNVTNMSYMFYYCSGLTSLDLSSFDTSNVTDMSYMFQYCTNLTSLDLSNFDTSKVTNMYQMFYNCRSLTSLNVSNFNTSNVYSMKEMFYNCRSLTSLDLSSFDTPKVIDMSYMFQYCSGLTSLNVNNFDTSKVSDMQYMFYYCINLTSLDVTSFDTSNVTTMSHMFYECYRLTSLDLSSFNTSNVTHMYNMFYSCNYLTSITFGNKADVSKVISYSEMFRYLPSNGTLTYPCAYSNAWNNLLVTNSGSTYFPSSWTKTCQPSEITNKIKFIENGVELSEGNFTVNDVQCAYNSEEQVWEVTYVAEQQVYSVLRDGVEVGSVDNSFKVNHVFIGDNNGSYNGFNVTETVSASSTSSSYRLIYSSFTQYVEHMFIDGVETTILSEKTFSSVGEHTVQMMIDTSNLTNMQFIFYKLSSGLTALDLSNFDTSNVTNMYAMFAESSGLTSVTFGDNFDTSNVTNMDSMFENCANLTSLDVTSFDTSNVTNMDSMFRSCPLTSLDLSNFNTSNVTNMRGMFVFCTRLTSVTFGNNFNTSNVTYMDGMFEYCIKLTSLDLSSFDTSKVTDMSVMFYECSGLTSITFGYKADVSKVTRYTNIFYNLKTSCKLILCNNIRKTWNKLISSYTLNVVENTCYTPTACTSLNITALDVKCKATSTTISYTAVTNGVDSEGTEVTNVNVIGTAESATFEQNTNTANTVTRTITFEYMGVTASTKITQGMWVDHNYSINLNNQWQLNTGITNPNSSLYDGVYQSYYNKGVHNSADICIITIEGYSTFTLYVRSNGENNYDYVVVSNLDCTLNNGTTSGSNVKATTNGKSTSDTSINSYTKVEFTNIDGGEHSIQVMYRKDGSSSSGNDRGYLLIPKEQ